MHVQDKRLREKKEAEWQRKRARMKNASPPNFTNR